MSIYINKDTKVITQGITGKTGQFHTLGCQAYANGKNAFVAGVNPKKAGEKFSDIPIYGTVKGNLAKTAEKVGEDLYSFKPTPEVRSLGQLIGHIADAQFSMCAAAAGEKPPQSGIEKSTTAKAALVKALNESIAYCDKVMDGMTDRGWGRIINVSSVNGQKGAFGQTNYSAAKAGIHGFTKALALEVARKGVTVNTISPGYIGTKMVTAIPKEILDSKILPQIPVGRLGKPDEIAGLIIYLCSDEAAFVTGANISINGGQHMY